MSCGLSHMEVNIHEYDFKCKSFKFLYYCFTLALKLLNFGLLIHKRPTIAACECLVIKICY